MRGGESYHSCKCGPTFANKKRGRLLIPSRSRPTSSCSEYEARRAWIRDRGCSSPFPDPCSLDGQGRKGPNGVEAIVANCRFFGKRAFRLLEASTAAMF